jgi:non-ribosomal peptide synthetase-like protein
MHATCFFLPRTRVHRPVCVCSGTLLKPWYFRAMGAKIGQRAYLGKCQLTEPDLLCLGDFATIEDGGTLQAHLFQDRMRLVKGMRLGDSCSVGANSVVLLGADMSNHSSLSSLSLLLRDETVPASTLWHGLPASRQECYLTSCSADAIEMKELRVVSS